MLKLPAKQPSQRHHYHRGRALFCLPQATNNKSQSPLELFGLPPVTSTSVRMMAIASEAQPNIRPTSLPPSPSINHHDGVWLLDPLLGTSTSSSATAVPFSRCLSLSPVASRPSSCAYLPSSMPSSKCHTDSLTGTELRHLSTPPLPCDRFTYSSPSLLGNNSGNQTSGETLTCLSTSIRHSPLAPLSSPTIVVMTTASLSPLASPSSECRIIATHSTLASSTLSSASPSGLQCRSTAVFSPTAARAQGITSSSCVLALPDCCLSTCPPIASTSSPPPASPHCRHSCHYPSLTRSGRRFRLLVSPLDYCLPGDSAERASFDLLLDNLTDVIVTVVDETGRLLHHDCRVSSSQLAVSVAALNSSLTRHSVWSEYVNKADLSIWTKHFCRARDETTIITTVAAQRWQAGHCPSTTIGDSTVPTGQGQPRRRPRAHLSDIYRVRLTGHWFEVSTLSLPTSPLPLSGSGSSSLTWTAGCHEQQQQIPILVHYHSILRSCEFTTSGDATAAIPSTGPVDSRDSMGKEANAQPPGVLGETISDLSTWESVETAPTTAAAAGDPYSPTVSPLASACLHHLPAPSPRHSKEPSLAEDPPPRLVTTDHQQQQQHRVPKQTTTGDSSHNRPEGAAPSAPVRHLQHQHRHLHHGDVSRHSTHHHRHVELKVATTTTAPPPLSVDVTRDVASEKLPSLVPFSNFGANNNNNSSWHDLTSFPEIAACSYLQPLPALETTGATGFGGDGCRQGGSSEVMVQSHSQWSELGSMTTAAIAVPFRQANCDHQQFAPTKAATTTATRVELAITTPRSTSRLGTSGIYPSPSASSICRTPAASWPSLPRSTVVVGNSIVVMPPQKRSPVTTANSSIVVGSNDNAVNIGLSSANKLQHGDWITRLQSLLPSEAKQEIRNICEDTYGQQSRELAQSVLVASPVATSALQEQCARRVREVVKRHLGPKALVNSRFLTVAPSTAGANTTSTNPVTTTVYCDGGVMTSAVEANRAAQSRAPLFSTCDLVAPVLTGSSLSVCNQNGISDQDVFRAGAPFGLPAIESKNAGVGLFSSVDQKVIDFAISTATAENCQTTMTATDLPSLSDCQKASSGGGTGGQCGMLEWLLSEEADLLPPSFYENTSAARLVSSSLSPHDGEDLASIILMSAAVSVGERGCGSADGSSTAISTAAATVPSSPVGVTLVKAEEVPAVKSGGDPKETGGAGGLATVSPPAPSQVSTVSAVRSDSLLVRLLHPTNQILFNPNPSPQSPPSVTSPTRIAGTAAVANGGSTGPRRRPSGNGSVSSSGGSSCTGGSSHASNGQLLVSLRPREVNSTSLPVGILPRPFPTLSSSSSGTTSVLPSRCITSVNRLPPSALGSPLSGANNKRRRSGPPTPLLDSSPLLLSSPTGRIRHVSSQQLRDQRETNPVSHRQVFLPIVATTAACSTSLTQLLLQDLPTTYGPCTTSTGLTSFHCSSSGSLGAGCVAAVATPPLSTCLHTPSEGDDTGPLTGHPFLQVASSAGGVRHLTPAGLQSCVVTTTSPSGATGTAWICTPVPATSPATSEVAHSPAQSTVQSPPQTVVMSMAQSTGESQPVQQSSLCRLLLDPQLGPQDVLVFGTGNHPVPVVSGLQPADSPRTKSRRLSSASGSGSGSTTTTTTRDRSPTDKKIRTVSMDVYEFSTSMSSNSDDLSLLSASDRSPELVFTSGGSSRRLSAPSSSSTFTGGMMRQTAMAYTPASANTTIAEQVEMLNEILRRDELERGAHLLLGDGGSVAVGEGGSGGSPQPKRSRIEQVVAPCAIAYPTEEPFEDPFTGYDPAGDDVVEGVTFSGADDAKAVARISERLQEGLMRSTLRPTVLHISTSGDAYLKAVESIDVSNSDRPPVNYISHKSNQDQELVTKLESPQAKGGGLCFDAQAMKQTAPALAPMQKHSSSCASRQQLNRAAVAAARASQLAAANQRSRLASQHLLVEQRERLMEHQRYNQVTVYPVHNAEVKVSCGAVTAPVSSSSRLTTNHDLLTSQHPEGQHLQHSPRGSTAMAMTSRSSATATAAAGWSTVPTRQLLMTEVAPGVQLTVTTVVPLSSASAAYTFSLAGRRASSGVCGTRYPEELARLLKTGGPNIQVKLSTISPLATGGTTTTTTTTNNCVALPTASVRSPHQKSTASRLPLSDCAPVCSQSSSPSEDDSHGYMVTCPTASSSSSGRGTRQVSWPPPRQQQQCPPPHPIRCPSRTGLSPLAPCQTLSSATVTTIAQQQQHVNVHSAEDDRLGLLRGSCCSTDGGGGTAALGKQVVSGSPAVAAAATPRRRPTRSPRRAEASDGDTASGAQRGGRGGAPVTSSSSDTSSPGSRTSPGQISLAIRPPTADAGRSPRPVVGRQQAALPRCPLSSTSAAFAQSIAPVTSYVAIASKPEPAPPPATATVQFVLGQAVCPQTGWPLSTSTTITTSSSSATFSSQPECSAPSMTVGDRLVHEMREVEEELPYRYQLGQVTTVTSSPTLLGNGHHQQPVLINNSNSFVLLAGGGDRELRRRQKPQPSPKVAPACLPAERPHSLLLLHSQQEMHDSVDGAADGGSAIEAFLHPQQQQQQPGLGSEDSLLPEDIINDVFDLETMVVSKQCQKQQQVVHPKALVKGGGRDFYTEAETAVAAAVNYCYPTVLLLSPAPVSIVDDCYQDGSSGNATTITNNIMTTMTVNNTDNSCVGFSRQRTTATVPDVSSGNAINIIMVTSDACTGQQSLPNIFTQLASTVSSSPSPCSPSPCLG